MTDTRYDFLRDSFFNVYTPVETPKVELNLPLFDKPIDISSWASGISPSGIPIVKPREQEQTSQQTPQQTNYSIIIDNAEEIPIQTSRSSQSSTKSYNSESNGAKILSSIIDEVSNEVGYEGLKDETTKKLIMLQASRESNFRQKVDNPAGSATGYFQFIDSTRKRYSNYSREDFKNDPKEQVRAAYKYFKDIQAMPQSKKLLNNGYNLAQVTALGWWLPKSMDMILNGIKNHSEGGYSITQAINDYKDFS